MLTKPVPHSPCEREALILEARARTLAMPTHDNADSEGVEVVAFKLAFETYGIETAYVSEVHSLKNLTPLPCTPPFVAGIINIHGQIFSVIDLKVFFDLQTKEPSDLNQVIIVAHADMEFGILADTILDVRRIPLSEVQPTLPTLTGIREDYLKGIARDSLIILNALNLLTDPRLIVDEGAI
ncbi:MAG: chemotaxis protein CheW [Gammaproteobacteria bacterium]